jgi:hypothetical protein
VNANLVAPILGVLAVWRVTHLLNAEDGPWDISVRVRRWAGDGFLGRALDCFMCLSLWIAVPVAAIQARRAVDGVLLWLALSGGAILLERVTARDERAGSFIEDRETHDVLRKPKTNDGEPNDARPAREPDRTS